MSPPRSAIRRNPFLCLFSRHLSRPSSPHPKYCRFSRFPRFRSLQTNQKGFEKLTNRGFLINILSLVAFSLLFVYLMFKVRARVGSRARGCSGHSPSRCSVAPEPFACARALTTHIPPPARAAHCRYCHPREHRQVSTDSSIASFDPYQILSVDRGASDKQVL